MAGNDVFLYVVEAGNDVRLRDPTTNGAGGAGGVAASEESGQVQAGSAVAAVVITAVSDSSQTQTGASVAALTSANIDAVSNGAQAQTTLAEAAQLNVATANTSQAQAGSSAAAVNVAGDITTSAGQTAQAVAGVTIECFSTSGQGAASVEAIAAAVDDGQPETPKKQDINSSGPGSSLSMSAYLEKFYGVQALPSAAFSRPAKFRSDNLALRRKREEEILLLCEFL